MAYEQSQNFIVQAEEALRKQNFEIAQRLFLQAAQIQHDYIQQLPSERKRSLAAYGLSAAVLYFRGNDLNAASRLAHQLLGDEIGEDYYREKLEELLLRIQNQKFLSKGLPKRNKQAIAVPLETVEGTLRAIDLDRKQLRIEQANGSQAALHLASGFSEEILGRLLNRQVIVTQTLPPKRKRYTVTDIELKPSV